MKLWIASERNNSNILTYRKWDVLVSYLWVGSQERTCAHLKPVVKLRKTTRLPCQLGATIFSRENIKGQIVKFSCRSRHIFRSPASLELLRCQVDRCFLSFCQSVDVTSDKVYGNNGTPLSIVRFWCLFVSVKSPNNAIPAKWPGFAGSDPEIRGKTRAE